MLKVEKLNTYYGAIHALKDLDIEIKEGEIVCLIGSNGAGKSTLVNTVSGVIPSTNGKISFLGEEITNLSPDKIVKKGMSLSPEGREVFPELSVKENLELGAFTVKDKKCLPERYQRVYDLFPKLKERSKQQAGTLSGGEQQMLAIGRALMSDPKLLVLDEPSLGIAPNLVIDIFNMIKRINEQGTTILLIEQNANIALQVSHRAYVLENGKVSMQGDAKDIASNSEIRKIYLGI